MNGKVTYGFMGNYETVENYANFFAEQGFVAFCFDFNGGCLQGKSDTDTTKMTVFTEAEDLKAVIAYTRKLPFVNNDGWKPGGIRLSTCWSGAEREDQKTDSLFPGLVYSG
ncbi:MAG: hypothetical protein LIO94_05320 [Clostridiales bacterium]|nr:hypothetical protein [Clostridiales bacterium]